MSALRKNEGVVPGMAEPRGSYPHFRRAGNFIYVSGTSSRLPDGTFVGASVDENGDLSLDMRRQVQAVIENIEEILKAAGCLFRTNSVWT